MGNEDGSIQVVFNGEIYNFQQLRDELLAKGHRFRTRSDTEVLVHLYEEQGEELVTRSARHVRVRDLGRPAAATGAGARSGGPEAALHLSMTEKLLFGSELKAILAHPNVDRTIDAAAVDDYLAFGMIPGQRAIFRKVRKLPPGHVLTVAPDRSTRAAAVLASPGRSASTALEQWQEALESKLVETVKAHQIADVPVGAFLSGGLDSSAMVAIQSAQSGAPVQTFSIGFQEAPFSELPYARQVADSTEHTYRTDCHARGRRRAGRPGALLRRTVCRLVGHSHAGGRAPRPAA